jgi:hypothetical protein
MEQTVMRLEGPLHFTTKEQRTLRVELVTTTPKMRLHMEMQKREQRVRRNLAQNLTLGLCSRLLYADLLTRGSGRGQRTSSSEHFGGGGRRSDAGGAVLLRWSSSRGAPATVNLETAAWRKKIPDGRCDQARCFAAAPPTMCQVRTSPSLKRSSSRHLWRYPAVIPELKSFPGVVHCEVGSSAGSVVYVCAK